MQRNREIDPEKLRPARAIRRLALPFAACIFAAFKGTAVGQPTSRPDDALPPPTTTAPVAPPRPPYLSLRYNEDYSFLDGPPGSFKPDFFDPIKNIHLDKDWTLRLGGEVRERMEAETNKNFGSRDPTQDTFLLERLALHADLKYRKLFRVFAEVMDDGMFDRDLPQSPGMENRSDINQAFFDLRVLGETVPLTLRAGRQELSYGRERVIGIQDWANSQRRFDGFKLFYQSPKLDVDVFYMKPIVFTAKPYTSSFKTTINEGLNRKPDKYREEQHFYGLYSVYKGIPGHTLDLYFLGLNDDNRRNQFANVNGRFGNMSVYTMGARFAGGMSGFDYDVEGAGQFGSFAGDKIHSWMVATDDGYTWKNLPWQPRLGVGFDGSSGDRTPRDGSIENYFQLFPTGHAALGYIDIVGRQNTLAPNVNVTFKPLKNVTTRLFYYHFWLTSNLDALYNKSGSPGRRNTTGSSGNDVGDEFDLTVNWQLDIHSSIIVGYSHFWPDSFINTTGRSRDADLVYVQYAFKF